MTSWEMSQNPSILSMILIRLAKALSAKSTRKDAVASSAFARWQVLIRFVLNLAGFGFLTLAGFSISFTCGLVVAGVSCFIFSWLSTTKEKEQPSELPHVGLRR